MGWDDRPPGPYVDTGWPSVIEILLTDSQFPMDDSKTFREQLAIRYPTLGRALWEPDPGGLYNAVQVGDVGFIRHGYFACLFDALSPRDRPSDYPPESDPHFPHYLQRLQPRTSNHIRASTDHRRDFRSKDVTNASREPNIGALGYRILVSSQTSVAYFTLH
jgi:hypothetical protein